MAIRGLIHALISRRQLHVISRSKSNIKPASPTPSNLKQYKLPLHDQMSPRTYIPMILFFPKYNFDHGPEQQTTTTSYLALKKSLSETLSKYYPFAGRLLYGDHRIDCNDQGVPFVEARIGCKLSEVVDKVSDKDNYTDLFPPGGIWDDLNEDSNPMVVQLNHFDCGGIAIAASLSHCVGDASTVGSFLSFWATLSRQYHCCDHRDKMLHNPRFVYELIYQSSKADYSVPSYASLPKKHWICTEMLFPNTDIAKLKAAVETEDKVDGVVDDQKYTRNELVTALLYRCAVRSTSTANNPKSVLSQMVNMRFMIDPPLPEKTVGNIITLNFIPTSTESETKLNRLASQIKKGKMQLKGIKSLDEYGVLPTVLAYKINNHRTYLISSLCNYFVYDEMDFGWGRPIKASVVDTIFVDMFVLMDTPTKDGIVVIASLEEKDMKKFVADKELLTYASF